MVQNGLITLKDCRVPEENRLQAGTSFRDTARVLRMTRYLVALGGDGVPDGGLRARASSTPRSVCSSASRSARSSSSRTCSPGCSPTSRPVSAWWCARRSSTRKASWTDHHAALSKAFCTAKMRETVAWAREILGGNGISTDYHVARFFADAEALYSYEGTYQMQNLIVGKAITGFSAFV